MKAGDVFAYPTMGGNPNELPPDAVFLVRNSSDVVVMGGRDNEVSITNSVFSRINDDVFDVENTDNELLVTNSVFNRVSGDLFRFENADDAELLFANNTINGPIGGFFFTFEGTGTTDFQAGSVGNINNTGLAATCSSSANASVTGQVEIDGVAFSC